jgi:glycerophosphoryl diester phosphodiesterase
MARPLPSETGRPLVIAHRGAKAYRPENTLVAYELAIEQGADMLEIDLHVSRDGRLPVAHDASLERFEREGEIADVSLAELRAISRAAHEARASEKRYEGIPVLEEVLDRFGALIPFNLELKTRTDHRPYGELEKLVLDQVLGRELLDQTLFSSFSDPVLAQLRRRCADARLGVLVDPRAPEAIFERADAVGAESINLHFAITQPELVARAHEKGLAVYVYTVDEPERMRQLLSFGVDGIFSNAPDELRKVVDSLDNSD